MGGGGQIAIFGEKNLQDHLINLREWPKNNTPYQEILIISPVVGFTRLPLQLGTKEYLHFDSVFE